MKQLPSLTLSAATALAAVWVAMALAPSFTGTPTALAQSAAAPVVCEIDGKAKTVVTARVVALDTPLIANRLGAQVPGGMIYALAGDVEPTAGANADWNSWTAGNVKLKDYKRARPMVLRVNQDQCLQVVFKNLLADTAPPGTSQPTTRAAGVFAQGLNWASPVLGPPGDKGQDDASWVGQNTNSLASPGEEKTYLLYAAEQGPFLIYSTGDDFTTGSGGNPAAGGGDGGQLTQGLFGAVMVQPPSAEYYRSQVNHEDLCLASADSKWNGKLCKRADPDKLPQIDYQAVYPKDHPRAGLTILNMVQDGELVHSDLTAIIAGRDKEGQLGSFPESMAKTPEFHSMPQAPERLEPYREFTIIYHELLRSVQAFETLYNHAQLKNLLEAGGDNFAINYGMGGIGSEILANRLAVGPMSECTDCKYEEFFLSSWPNGDPAMVVDQAADTSCKITGTNTEDYTTYKCPNPAQATRALYPDDPSNVYHGYLWDHTKFRILHGGVDLHHLHHLHAHQWQRSPNSSDSTYLDSQAIGPGSAFTLETVYNGGGNKNLTVGDSIFHCHFYPHFAAGMWALWRVHDVFEEGTELTAYPSPKNFAGPPIPNARALPDGEISAGTPIPAIVPLPTKAMAPMPAPVQLVKGGTEIEVCKGDQSNPQMCISNLAAAGSAKEYKNPGFPFFIPGIAGSRASHPPLDFALACSVSGAACSTSGAACGGGGGICEPLDGGLPRHLVETGGVTHAGKLNPLDFTKDVEQATAFGLPEEGTVIEQVAMSYHEKRTHSSFTSSGVAKDFITNGKPRISGAPYAEPCITLKGNFPEELSFRDYWAVDIQTTATFNEEGWHYPQQRMISLWGDAWDYLGIRPKSPQRPPEPFFFRANSFDCVRYRLANLVPKTYELDDFQVRTPTDVLGQHIHLVKFDVTSSDGAANGYNYEDGTLAPDEVIERINAFNNGVFKPTFEAKPQKGQLEPKFIKFFGADPACASGENAKLEQCACKVVAYRGEGGKPKFSVRGGQWCGAQATFQRWYVDPQLTNSGDDKTIRTVFTHDHFSPSTHQQTGLYAGLVAEPYESKWLNNEDGSVLGNRSASQNGVKLADGGPTSWQAVIQTDDKRESYREFLFEFQDTTLMYRPFNKTIAAPACPIGVSCGFCSNDHTKACVTNAASQLYYGKVCKAVDLPIPEAGAGVNSKLEPSCNFIAGIPSKNSLFFTDTNTASNIWGVTNSTITPELEAVGWDTLPITPGPKGVVVAENNKQTKAAQPELISFNGGTDNFSLNYRNEPLFPRVHSTAGDPNRNDLSYAYASLDRQLPGQQPPPYATPLTPGIEPGDPFTPLLRAYAGDDVQIRALVGAHQNPHNFTLHGNNWLYEPANTNSGWRNSQIMGISEHFEMLFQLPAELEQPDAKKKANAWTDYLYKSTAAKQGQASGNWGLMRSYGKPQKDLHPLPQNQSPPTTALPVCPADLLKADCSEQMPDGFYASKADANGHRLRCYSVVATTVADIGFSNGLIYNTKSQYSAPNGLIYLHLQDYEKLRSTPPQPVPGFNQAEGLAEPLVLRAAAGDCLKVNLSNRLPESGGLGNGFSSRQLPVAGVEDAQRNLYVPSEISREVGLRPQLVAYNAAQSDGTNVGTNPAQTAPPGGGSQTYWWYAGNIDRTAPAGQQHIPIEFGAANLMPSDPINHHAYGLFGGLVIEPAQSTWQTDPNSRASATVTDLKGNLLFREFVAIVQDDIVLQQGGGRAGGVGAVNYRIENINEFVGVRTCPKLPDGSLDVSCVLSNEAICSNGQCGFSNEVPIQTPLFCARKGHQARFRLLHPGGAVTNQVFELHGHPFLEEPYSVTAQANCATPMTHSNPRASEIISVSNICPDGNVDVGPSLSEWKAARMGHGPSNHYDVVVETAGGANFASGDYLYRTYPANHFSSGIWGIFRVTGKALDDPLVTPRCPSLQPPGKHAGLKSDRSPQHALASGSGGIEVKSGARQSD